MQEQYFVYIIQCGDQSYYVGLTNDLIKRFNEHLEKKYDSCYTFSRHPLKLVYYETIPFLKEATEREVQIKGWTRVKKKALIDSNLHKLQLLAECQNMTHHKYKDIDDMTSTPLSQENLTGSVSSGSLRDRPSTPLRIGILGGGQLGRMLLQAAANYPVETYILENDAECPSAHLCHHFVLGDIKSFDDVYNFGKDLDAVTIEIESVNVDALEKLEVEGVKVYPTSKVIRTIKNKISQKGFYLKNDIPSPEFVITHSAEEIKKFIAMIPGVHKIGEGGYDGRGVQLIHSAEDFSKGFNAPSVLEKMVDIKKEIAIIVAANSTGETAIYPAAEMVMDQQLNQLSHQISPSSLSKDILDKAEAIALELVKSFASPGLFAIEFFVDRNDAVWVNETAPRVHNSGHHTIEGNYSSQFDMLWRVMLNYPLGNTKPIQHSALINVVGEEGHSGKAKYEGLEDVLKLDNCFVHIYGKKETRPGRKMGHVTVLNNDTQELIQQVAMIKQRLKVCSL